MVVDLDISMGFDLLFDEQLSSSSQDRTQQRQETVTCMYMRALRRLCACEDPNDRKVLALVRETLIDRGSSEGLNRNEILEEIYDSLTDANYRARLCSSRGSSGNSVGPMCSGHTYLQLETGDEDTSYQPIIVEPNLREEFQIVRPTPQYNRLLETLPLTFVGSPFRFAALIDFMSARMEESFRAAGMSTPPWRQKGSLLSKWELTEHVGKSQPSRHMPLFSTSNDLFLPGRPTLILPERLQTSQQTGFVANFPKSSRPVIAR